MKNNCFGLRNGTQCGILYDDENTKPRCCAPDKCAFYKSREQHRHDRAEALARLRTLEPSMQQGIAEKYYRGKMKWNEA